MAPSGNEIFGRRREPHTVIIARGDDIRHFTVRPWMTALIGSVVVAFAIGYLAATSYLVFRDDLINASIARQARIQHAYEDRIAALRSQMDRIISRQLLDQQEMEEKVVALMDRQQALFDRHSKLGPLLDRVETGSVAVPTPTTRPASGEKRASLGSVPRIAFGSHRSDDTATGHLAADQADRTFADIAASIDSIETAQIDRLNLLAHEASSAARAIETALVSIGVEPDQPEDAETGLGGPLIDASGMSDADLFSQTIEELDAALSALDSAQTQARRLPIADPVPGKSISSRFGVRKDPILGTRAFHSGTDFRAPTGTPVRVSGKGTVIAAGWSGGYGRMVEVKHPSGHVTRYAHLSKIRVNVGETLAAGDVVGAVGSSGRSTGPHLHYEVRKGKTAVNPELFLKAGRDLKGLL